MANARDPDRGESWDDQHSERNAARGDETTTSYPRAPSADDTATVAMSTPQPQDASDADAEGQRERRFTAPGFDAKETQVMAAATGADPATEMIHTPAPTGPARPPAPSPQTGAPPKTATPQSIPPREGGKLKTAKHFNWGWVLAIVVVILAVVAIAILGTVLLLGGKRSKVSQEDQVRHTIQSFDVAVQTGDLTALRTITCGTTRDGYADYDEHAWQETYRRVAAAKQYPVIASIDQVVVNGQHAEANVTSFMAYDPQVRSTRSFDLEFRDNQWKICQAPSG